MTDHESHAAEHAVNAEPVPTLESQIGYWLRYLSNQVSSRLDEELWKLGFTETESVFLRAMFPAKFVTHMALQRQLGLTRSAAAKVLQKLERKGLVARQLAEGSARSQWLWLTPSGEALVPVLAAIAADNDMHFFRHMTPGQETACETAMIGLHTGRDSR